MDTTLFKKSMLGFFSLLLLFSVSSCALKKNQEESKARAEITALLQKWPQDFNAKNIPGVCGLFATHLTASFAGMADKNYEEMCHSLTSLLTNSDQHLHYDAPDIQEILIEGHLAVVRVIWTLRMSNKDQSEVTVIKEKSLDIFKRQADGKWQMIIFSAYPEQENSPTNR